MSPVLASFAKDLTSLEINALGKVRPDEKPEITSYRTRLQNISDSMIVAAQPQEDHSPDDSPLRVTMDSILDMVRKETAQVPYAPVRTMTGICKDWAGGLWHNIKEHPKTSAIAAPIIAAAMWGVNSFTSATNIRLTPAHMTEVDLIPGEESMTIDPSLAQDTVTVCHEHLAFNIGNQEISLFPKHCIIVDTFTNDMMGYANSAFGFVGSFSERLRPVTEGAVVSLNGAFPPHLAQALTEAAHNAGNYVVSFDQLENTAFHLGFTAVQWAATHKFAVMDGNEIREHWNKARDFVVRSMSGNGLVYAGAAAAYFSCAPGTNAFWPMVGGSLAGYFTHEAARVWNRAGHVRDVMEPAIPKTLREQFRQACDRGPLFYVRSLHERTSEIARNTYRDVSEALHEKFQSACHSIKELPARLHSVKKKTGNIARSALHGDFASLREAMPASKTCAIVFTKAAGVGLVGTVFADANGMLDNETLQQVSTLAVKAGAYLGVGGAYVVVNGPQDAVIHIPYLVVGGVGGVTTGAISKLITSFRSGKSNDMGGPDMGSGLG
ncbi:MAG: hypothetical protein WBK55_08360 [Alphaproteobacteria bacterium]